MLQLENCKLYNEDAYLLIDKLTEKKIVVNHIITDPPYNISRKNNFNTLGNRQGVYFGDWDKNFDLTTWIPEYGKLLNKNGSIIIFCSYQYISYICAALEQSGFVLKDLLEWEKTNPMPRNVERRYVQDKELAIWAVKKGAKWTFNKPEDAKYLRSTFKYSIVQGKERTKHPNQKNLALMKKIIDIHTNPGDIIIDPFMGSGTTGVAALEKGRLFIGNELDKEYFNIAKTRIENMKR